MNSDTIPLLTPSGSTNSTNSFTVNNRIMIVAIVVLLGVVLFIFGLHLYAKWFWRNGGGAFHVSASGSWRRRRRLEFAAQLEEQARSIGQVGLDDSIVEKLPTFVFNQDKATAGGIECAVCLEEFKEGEKGRLLPKCSHSFHIDCIDMWFHSHSTCPLCRCSVAPDVPPGADVSAFGSAFRRGDSTPPQSDGSLYSTPSSSFPASATIYLEDSQGLQVVIDTGIPASDIPEASAPSLGSAPTGDSQRRASSVVSTPKPSGVQYPANVLFWGNQSQINVGSAAGLQREESNASRQAAGLAIEIPRGLASIPVAQTGDEPSRLSDAQAGLKSPIGRLVTTSFRRLLSIRRGAASPGADANSSCGSNDCEQGAAAVSST